ncbi:hypothetical protein [Chitinophaga vietnamensis]|uniref:hypothetical protein n=1 Tax=Chitinophaga vietnamensis TaxID=2593957 RepID=UPI0011780FE0|nr:hypothetical protein [Chitinophaga vietnamensis]
MFQRAVPGIICFLFCQLLASAQSLRFSQSVGLGLFTARNYLSGGLVYSPRYNFFVLSPRAAVSVGTHLGLGANLHESYTSNSSGESSSVFIIDVPLVINYNYGNAATRKASQRWGFFAGGGYGFHNASRNIDNTDLEEESGTEAIHIKGPVLNAGLQFPLGRSSLSLRGAWLLNDGTNNKDIQSITSVGVSYNIGVHFK